MGLRYLNGARAAWLGCARRVQEGNISSKETFCTSSVQRSQEPLDKKSQEGGWAGSMAEVKASQLRLLFAGVGHFPTAVTRTCEALESHPHIRVECLPQNEILDKIHEYDMCICRMGKFDRDVLLRATRLKLLAQFGMGLEGVDIEAATEMGIKVGRIPSASSGNALSCAEHAIYLILSLLRDQKGLMKSVQERKLGRPEGRTLFGSTVVIVGFGNIGHELAPRLKPFGVRILAVRRSWNHKYPIASDNLNAVEQMTNGTDKTDNAVDERGGMEHLHQFLSRSDIVVLCCPLTPKTKGMVNEAFLTSMKRGAMLVNVARGGLMDYNAVSAALESGQLGGLGSDVTWVEPIDPKDPIIQHPNVVITPHIAGVTEFSYLTMGQAVAKSAIQLYEGKEITDLEFVN